MGSIRSPSWSYKTQGHVGYGSVEKQIIPADDYHCGRESSALSISIFDPFLCVLFRNKYFIIFNVMNLFLSA